MINGSLAGWSRILSQRETVVRRLNAGVPSSAAGLIADVRQVERLRLVRALVGFTRFDAPDPDDPGLGDHRPAERDAVPTWAPATEVRGEGRFVRLDPRALADWERRAGDPAVRDKHRRQAFARFRRNRYSERIPGRREGCPAQSPLRTSGLNTIPATGG